MKRLTPRASPFLAIDVALAVLCIVNIPTLLNRAEAPIAVRQSDERVLITEPLDSSRCSNIRAGDELMLWEDTPVRSPESIEFLAEICPVGTRVPLLLQRDGRPVEASITLVPAYTLSYVLIVSFVALLTWCLGVFVLIARTRDLAASTLHWALVMMAVSVGTAYEGTTPSNPVPLLSSLLFFISYAGTATAFLLFTALFPRSKPGSLLLKIILVFTPAGVILAFMMYHYARVLASTSVEAFTEYDIWFRVFHILLLLFVAGGIFTFIHSYITSVSTEERKKLKWILWGLSLGPLPFLGLVVVPRQFNFVPVIPEEFTLLALLVIPVSFVISFVRYRLMDIEVVIRRTTTYAVVIGVLLAVYTALVSVAASLVGQLTASAAASIVIALFFEPLRRRVQRTIDRRFFRVQYNFRLAEQRFVELIKQTLTVAQLGDILVRETHALIPLERIGLFTLREPGGRLRMIAHEGFGQLTIHTPRFEAQKLKTGLHLPVALSDSLEPGIPHEPADSQVFQRWGLSLVFPMLAQEEEVLGFLALGRKKSGLRFSIEDVDLLKNVCTQAGLAVERIVLQEKLLMEHQERERLWELNRFKSDFVSYVSHELRTPLTSIKMFAELLRGRPLKLGAKGAGYVRIIEGEADRLDRMVTTILDSARIDSDMKVYEFKESDLARAARTALRIMRYQLDKQKFRVEWSVTPARRRDGNGLSLPIRADHDAVVQAITNLISNAIKYSGNRRSLKISLSRKGQLAVCKVADRGIGIAPEALPHIFEKFYRDGAAGQRAQGFGLGLPLVKHIMEAHRGSVDVVSSKGKGTTISLSFPLFVPVDGWEVKNTGH